MLTKLENKFAEASKMHSSASDLWKAAASKRAAEFAAKIMNEAELRARHQWEAAHIQGIAVATAKTTAEMARKKAEEAKLLLAGTTVTTESREAMRVQALAAYKEEVAVQASASWRLQMKTVTWIYEQAAEYETSCLAFKATLLATDGDVLKLMEQTDELKLKSELTSNPVDIIAYQKS